MKCRRDLKAWKPWDTAESIVSLPGAGGRKENQPGGNCREGGPWPPEARSRLWASGASPGASPCAKQSTCVNTLRRPLKSSGNTSSGGTV